MRREKNNYYLDIAEAAASRGTCLRRNYGCIIVKNDEIISTGYSGAPRGRKNCTDLNYCYRESLQIPRGQKKFVRDYARLNTPGQLSLAESTAVSSPLLAGRLTSRPSMTAP